MKKCPYCAEDIQDEAKKCKHCGEWLKDSKQLSLIVKIKTARELYPIAKELCKDTGLSFEKAKEALKVGARWNFTNISEAHSIADKYKQLGCHIHFTTPVHQVKNLQDNTNIPAEQSKNPISLKANLAYLILAIVIILFITLLLPKISPDDVDTAKDNIPQSNIEYYNDNSQEILSTMRSAIEKKEYGLAVTLGSTYQASKDPELLSLYSEAKTRALEARKKADSEAKALAAKARKQAESDAKPVAIAAKNVRGSDITLTLPKYIVKGLPSEIKGNYRIIEHDTYKTQWLVYDVNRWKKQKEQLGGVEMSGDEIKMYPPINSYAYINGKWSQQVYLEPIVNVYQVHLVSIIKADSPVKQPPKEPEQMSADKAKSIVWSKIKYKDYWSIATFQHGGGILLCGYNTAMPAGIGAWWSKGDKIYNVNGIAANITDKFEFTNDITIDAAMNICRK